MNILQFNVRLAEGGAAGVALDLHQRALQQGLASHFVYGYGKGGKESVSHQNYPQVIKHTPRMTAMANIALFRLFNRDLFGNFNELYRTITRTPGPVVLHFHVLHSYWLNLNSVVRFCEKVKNHKPDVTLVWTLHDHWSVTGRCAFTDGCEGWKTGCQKCPTLNNYPPVKIDRAHQLVAGKRQLFREMLALGCQFISPSQHVADAFNSLYGPGRCRIINNGIDMATEAILADLPPVRETQGKPKIAVVALAAVEMAQIILTGGSSIMESISKYLIYSNSYVLNFIKFGGKRTTALYFEPAFFALALISIWLSIKQFGIKTPKTDALILAGIILSGSFSGVMTFILFYLLEWAFQYLNKEAIKKKLPLALISLAVFRVGVVIAFPYISTRLGDLGTG